MALDFPAAPTTGQKYPQPPVAGVPVYSWDGEKWTTYGGLLNPQGPADALPLMDATPALIGTSMEYAREDHIHPTDTSRASVTDLNDAIAAADSTFGSQMAYSGMQINGGMEVSQENGGGVVSVSGASKYIVDGWSLASNGAQVMTGQNGSSTAPGFISHLSVIPTTANVSPAAGNYVTIMQKIEGYRIARLQWGTANAQPITIGFWIYANRAGNYSGAIENGTSNRSYPFLITVAAATWEYKTITIPGDTTGTWAKDNTPGMLIIIAPMVGSTYQAAANVWAAGNYFGVSGVTNGVAATSDLFAITGVTVLPGTQAPTAAQSPNVMRPYGEELMTCKRYYERSTDNQSATLFSGYATPSAVFYTFMRFQVPKRVIPTVVLSNYGTAPGFPTTSGGASAGLDGFYETRTSNATHAGGSFGSNWTADARL